LDAIEQFGFGNWEDISEHIETRTAEGNLIELFYEKEKTINIIRKIKDICN